MENQRESSVYNIPATTTFISKYKPYFLDDFYVDSKLKYMIRTLKEIDDLNLLIVGNSSSGKTSLLYAIIREYYGLTKTQGFPENNILFINNLKEQGISYYRAEMKAFCQSHSSIYGKKKMIIVDDIDLISEQCQQVFRNYIDKYKNNVHFISACSSIQKVIESIQSRTHILCIRPNTSDDIRKIIEKICKEESILLSDETKEYLIKFSNNSIRQVINHLEKIYILNGDLDKSELQVEKCKTICSTISFQQFENYICHIKSRQLTDAVKLLYDIHDYGYSVIDILDYFFTFVKTTALLNEDEKYKIIPVLCEYITVFHSIHEDVIELALLSNDLLNIFFAE
jgi:DNA polymerase III delta prime subunit